MSGEDVLPATSHHTCRQRKRCCRSIWTRSRTAISRRSRASCHAMLRWRTPSCTRRICTRGRHYRAGLLTRQAEDRARTTCRSKAERDHLQTGGGSCSTTRTGDESTQPDPVDEVAGTGSEPTVLIHDANRYEEEEEKHREEERQRKQRQPEEEHQRQAQAATYKQRQPEAQHQREEKQEAATYQALPTRTASRTTRTASRTAADEAHTHQPHTNQPQGDQHHDIKAGRVDRIKLVGPDKLLVKSCVTRTAKSKGLI